MGTRDRYRRWLRLRFGRRDLEREVDDEIETHIALRTEELIRSGEPPERAREEALRRFGDLAKARRQLKESGLRREGRLSRGRLIASVVSDLRLAVRQARNAPGFTLLTVFTFALGIGLATLVYTVVDRVLLRPLPFPHPHRLVALLSVDSARGEFPQVSMANWMDWREGSRSLASTALLRERVFTLVANDEAVRVPGAEVAGPFFDVLGTQMLVGRPFGEGEAQAAAPVAVVSERFWRIRMGAAPSRGTVLVDGSPLEVVGVVPDGGGYPLDTDIWVGEILTKRGGNGRNLINYRAIGRLREGVDAREARTELSGIADRIRHSDPVGLYSWGVGVVPLLDLEVGNARPSLMLLMGGVTFVLLVACANIAGLALTRASGRRRETAMRLAIGAGRLRVMQQLVTETLVLAVGGGILGIALAGWSLSILIARVGQDLPRATELGLDARVIAVAVAATFATGLLCGLGPALEGARVPLRDLIGSRRLVRGGRNLPGRILVAAEMAIALVLLAGGAALIRSYRVVLSQDVGFDPHGVLAAEVVLASPPYQSDPERRIRFWEALIERTRDVAGVSSVAVGNWIPTGYAGGVSFIDVEGDTGGNPGAGYRIVSDDYFRTMRVPLLAGRTFDGRDRFGSERVAIVNRRMAESFWPGESPLGRRLRASSMESEVEGGAPWLRVIGVVDNVRHFGYESDPRPEVYTLHRQLHTTLTSTMTLVVRGSPAVLGALHTEVRSVVTGIDPSIATDIAPLDARLARLVGERRLIMALLTGFGLLALLLAAVGIYGLVSFAVAQRTGEIGVRAALGAQRSGIVRFMLWNALRVVLAGALFGVAGAFLLTRLMQGMLFGVRPGDPLAFAASLAVLLLAGVLAALIPALRASRLDPLEALRQT
jgi:predicted permease